MVKPKSIATEVFAIDWFDLVEYCPALAGKSPEDVETYALAHRDEITRAVVAWSTDHVWANVSGASWELGEYGGEVLVQLVLCCC